MRASLLSTKERLTRLGFTVHKGDENGKLKGMKIKMGGIQIHNTPYAHVTYANELCDKLERKSIHVSLKDIENEH